MKKIVHLPSFVLVLFVMSACMTATQQHAVKTSSQPVEEMINPGDKIGDFLITTGDNENITFLADIHCPLDQSTGIKSCELSVGTKLNVSSGIYDDDVKSGKNLDQYWSEPTYAIYIEGHPIDLQPFGSIDITHSILGKMRLWNVVIVTDKPGKIAVKNLIVSDGESFEFNFSITFIAP